MVVPRSGCSIGTNKPRACELRVAQQRLGWRAPPRRGDDGAARPRTARRRCSVQPRRRGRRRGAPRARVGTGRCVQASSPRSASIPSALHPFDECRPVAERAVHHGTVGAAADAEAPRPVQASRSGAPSSRSDGTAPARARATPATAACRLTSTTLPAAGALARQQRRDHADRGEHGRLVIGLEAERVRSGGPSA